MVTVPFVALDDVTVNVLPSTSVSFTITYTISDGNGGTATATITVTVNAENDAPVAVNDVATVSEDSSNNTVAVLANDSDTDGDTLTVTTATAANGAVTINSDGTLDYAPNADFNGADTISYTISDGNYAKLLFSNFTKERVESELDECLKFNFIERCGGGIGVTRMIRAMELSNLI